MINVGYQIPENFDSCPVSGSVSLIAYNKILK